MRDSIADAGTAGARVGQLIDRERYRRLVRLCAHLVGDPWSAEDLAQETLLEAWRHRDRLYDVTGVDPWLAAIARNVCRRSLRTRQTRIAVAETSAEPADGPAAPATEDVVAGVDLRSPLTSALAGLPPASQELVIERVLLDLPLEEVAERHEMSPDAVTMRVGRAKKRLRQILTEEHPEALAGYVTAQTEWMATRSWCLHCAEHRLVLRRSASPRAITVRCPGCDVGAVAAAEFRLDHRAFSDLLGSLSRPSAILARATAWSGSYFSGGVGSWVACTCCTARVRITTYVREDAPHAGDRQGVVAACDRCGVVTSSSLAGLAASQPSGRRFRAEHSRVFLMPPREVIRHGRRTLVQSLRARESSARRDVLLAADTFEVVGDFGSDTSET